MGFSKNRYMANLRREYCRMQDKKSQEYCRILRASLGEAYKCRFLWALASRFFNAANGDTSSKVAMKEGFRGSQMSDSHGRAR